MQDMEVRSLARELRSHMLRGAVKNKTRIMLQEFVGSPMIGPRDHGSWLGPGWVQCFHWQDRSLVGELISYMP